LSDDRNWAISKTMFCSMRYLRSSFNEASFAANSRGGRKGRWSVSIVLTTTLSVRFRVRTSPEVEIGALIALGRRAAYVSLNEAADAHC
jgi:hypothetical protein